MLAIKRNYLAPFLTAAAILFTAVPAAGIAVAMTSPASSAVHHIPLADCPAGTNWDNVTQTCVS